MRVLVTGAAGHVGSAIVHHLKPEHELVSLIHRSPAHPASDVQQIQETLGAPDFVANVVRQTGPCDAIIHSAASLSMDLTSTEVSQTNCVGTQQVLKLASKWRIRSFIYISSVQVIGLPRLSPITEHHPTCPLTSYHASKLFGEHLVALFANDAVRVISLRLTATIGSGMRCDRILPVFIREAAANRELLLAGKGSRRQDYIDVRDVARAVSACLESDVPSGLFNIGRGENISNVDLARLCIRILGSDSGLRLSGTDAQEGISWDVSIAKARELLSFEPSIPLEQTIREMSLVNAHRGC